MAIEDPISALQSLNASDNRQRSPVSRLAKPFLAIVKLFTPPGGEFTFGGIEAAVDWLGRREEENRQELVEVLAEELKYRGSQIEQIMAESQEHRRFMAEDMPGLVLDALRRAEQTRAKDRIHRLARILVHAAEVGPQDGADYPEEMMRIALELMDRDVLVLREIYRALASSVVGGSRGATPHTTALQQWRNITGRLSMTEGEVLSTCLKMEGYGLVRRAEDRSKNNLSDEPLAFGLLHKGKDFVEYLQSAAKVTVE